MTCGPCGGVPPAAPPAGSSLSRPCPCEPAIDVVRNRVNLSAARNGEIIIASSDAPWANADVSIAPGGDPALANATVRIYARVNDIRVQVAQGTLASVNTPQVVARARGFGVSGWDATIQLPNANPTPTTLTVMTLAVFGATPAPPPFSPTAPVDGNPIYWDAAAGQWSPIQSHFRWSGGLDTQLLPLVAVDAVRQNAYTFDGTPNAVIDAYTPPVGTVNVTQVRVVRELLATRTDVIGDAAWFLLRGVWLFTGGVFTAVRAPEVVASSATAGAATWVAQLAIGGAPAAIQTQVTGQAAKTIRWQCIREAIEGI